MYQYDSKNKTQSEKSKESPPTMNKDHEQTKLKMPTQMKSLLTPYFNQENDSEKSSSNYVSRLAQLMPLTYSPLQMQLMPKQTNKELQPLPIKLGENQEKPVPIPAKPNNTGIPLQMKERFENLSGFSFDDVRVHYNSDKPKQLQALAYTQGNQVHIAPGQEKHLGHELGHVIQQKQGIVWPNISVNGLQINNSPVLERAADNPYNYHRVSEKTRTIQVSDIVQAASANAYRNNLNQALVNNANRIVDHSMLDGLGADDVLGLTNHQMRQDAVSAAVTNPLQQNIPDQGNHVFNDIDTSLEQFLIDLHVHMLTMAGDYQDGDKVAKEISNRANYIATVVETFRTGTFNALRNSFVGGRSHPSMIIQQQVNENNDITYSIYTNYFLYHCANTLSSLVLASNFPEYLVDHAIDIPAKNLILPANLARYTATRTHLQNLVDEFRNTLIRVKVILNTAIDYVRKNPDSGYEPDLFQNYLNM